MTSAAAVQRRRPPCGMPRLPAARVVADAFDVAAAAQRAWAQTPLPDRVRLILRFGEELRSREVELAAVLTRELGKPAAAARGEARAAAARVAALAAAAPSALAARDARGGPLRERVEREPLGVVAAISAWNYPLLLGVNAAVPALLAGNAVLYKPSEVSPEAGAAVARAAHAAGLHPALFNALPPSRAVGKALAAQPGLGALCFTGSHATGRAVARAAALAAAGAGGVPPRLLLELGGKDAAYVRADADVERAAAAIAAGAFSNAGQSCCSVERVYVHADVAQRFTAALCAAAAQLVPGETLAPLARGAPAARLLAAHVADSVAQGATIAFQTPAHRMPPHQSYDPTRDGAAPGSDIARRRGRNGRNRPLFFPATVLTGCDHAMAAMREESFGPLACVQAVRSDGEAAALMNDSSYGLTAAVFSADEAAAAAILRRLDVGTGYWNACDRVSPHVPWSGRRGSGAGWALGEEGIRAMTQPKALHLFAWAPPPQSAAEPST